MGQVETDIIARLARIEAEDDHLKSFIRVDTDAALADARAVDTRAAAGEPSRLLEGVAVAVKDNIAVAGKPWTGGIAGWRTRIANSDAGVVTRLQDAGAVILGGLNMEEGALGATTDNPTFGRCQNPLADGFTPGGSSGGSGAAVAAGLVDMALGSDTMGSVRMPAAYCGITGLKPTTGLIGRSGFAYLSPTLDTIGPLARSVADLWPATLAIAGLDNDDPASRPAPAGWVNQEKPSDLRGLRIAVPKQIESIDCEAPISEGHRIAVAALRDLGAEVVELDLVGWDPTGTRRGGLVLSEAEGAIQMAELMDQQGALSDHLHGLLNYGRTVPAAKLVSALASINAAAAAFDRAMAECDGLILPTAPQRAFRHGTPPPANQADLTALANFSGSPAVALPVPLPGEVLPASVQLMGPHWSEARLLAWAELLEGRLSNDG